MASLYREALLPAPADAVWAALREAGAVDRLFPGVLAAARLEGETRIVTFTDGQEVRERILGLDEGRRRIAYAVLREGLHHAAAMRVVAEGADRCRFLWTTDVRPDAAAARIAALMDAGIAALQRWAAG
jgi:carbon monoxide dehydrogenase subunit G